MPIITSTSVVTLHFTIKLKDGSVADSTHNMGKPAKFVMGDGSLSPNFEQCLLGLTIDDIQSVELQAKDAFGLPNPDSIHYMDRSRFSGKNWKWVPSWPLMVLTVWKSLVSFSEVSGESVTVDFNHPLSGQDVIFDVEILNVE